MEVVVDYEALKGGHSETIIKEVAVVADGVVRTLHFEDPLRHLATRFR